MIEIHQFFFFYKTLDEFPEAALQSVTLSFICVQVDHQSDIFLITSSHTSKLRSETHNSSFNMMTLSPVGTGTADKRKRFGELTPDENCLLSPSAY